MSIARVHSFAFAGIDAVPVEVQVQVSSGLPAFLVVGLPDKAVGEARERVRAALTAMGLALPPRRVLINLAPADLLKEGSHFDLPIALAVLAAMDVLPREDLAGYAALGELSLDGALNPVAGVLPAAIGASARGLGLICPAAQGGEAAWAGQVEVLALPDLLCAVNHFRGTQVLSPPGPAGIRAEADGPDLADVKGMETAKRAMEIAAAGAHNLLLIGPPGAGKSMLASRLPGLLPDLTPPEALEVSMIHSVAGLLDGGRLVMRPPYREPHHSASQAALTGGGCQFHRLTGLNNSKLDSRALPRPGEISLAHRGVLYLDDIFSFPRDFLCSVDATLRHGTNVVGASRGNVSFPAHFQLIAGVGETEWMQVLSGSVLPANRSKLGENHNALAQVAEWFDVAAWVLPVDQAALPYAADPETTSVVSQRVGLARDALRKRSDAAIIADDHGIPQSLPACQTDAQALAFEVCSKSGLGELELAKIMRVARTIADLAGIAVLARHHVAEACFHRSAFRRMSVHPS